MNERLIEWKTYGVTVLDPLTIVVSLALLGLAIFGNRRSALAPFLIAIAILPAAQRLVIFDLDFPMVRLIMTIAWVTLLAGRSSGPFRWDRLNTIDKALIIWALSGALIYILRRGDGIAVAYRAGILLDAFGMYFLIRQKVWRSDQILSGMVVCAWIAALLGVAMGVEFATGRNYFSIFGSAREHTMIRNGEFRAVSSFSHPIMAGTFGALMSTMMIGLWVRGRKYRIPAGLGFIGALQIVAASNSSGPLIAAAFGIGCWGTWRVRHHLTTILWGVVGSSVVIHLIREKPIWHLILRAGEVMGGGTGYHRYFLIDATVNNWEKWIAAGTDDVASWGWGLQDLTNQWVFEAVNGGLLTLLAFNFLLFVCFRELGRTFVAIQQAQGLSRSERKRLLFLCWTHGAVLAVFCMSFISVALFGQMNALFYLQIALISSFTQLPEIRHATSAANRVAAAEDREELDSSAQAEAPDGAVAGLLARSRAES